MKNYLIIPALFSMLAFTFSSCSEDANPDVLGTGEVKIGMGIKLTNFGNPGSRIYNSGLEINSGFIQIKEIELETEGVDGEGREFEKELVYKFPEIKKIDFDKFDTAADFFLAIPSGNYEEIEVELDLIDNRNQPSLELNGTYTMRDGSSVPFKFQIFGNDDDDWNFEVELEAEDDDDLFFLDRVNNPLALFQIKAEGWFSEVSRSDFESAELTEGILLITNQLNKSIFRKVERKIKDSTEIELIMK